MKPFNLFPKSHAKAAPVRVPFKPRKSGQTHAERLMRRIPHISAGQPTLSGNEQRYVREALHSTQLTMGPYVRRFEAAFAEYIGVKHAISVMNGTAALHLTLAALGIGPGDEVIVPALTFVATANAVTYCGATPVMVDVDPDTWCLDPVKTAAALTPRTKAIVPVHLYGVPADMRALRALALQDCLFLVEDAAEALGAAVAGHRVGNLGDAACFSFYGNKTITTGEGGMITTDDDLLATRLRLLRGQGQTPGQRYWHEVIGFNYRMTDLQGALGLAQMEVLPGLLERRRQVIRLYQTLLPDVTWQTLRPEDTHGCWALAVLLPESYPVSAVMAQLEQTGIETRPVFYPLNDLPMYKQDGNPVAAALSRRGLVLPTHAELTDADVYYVVDRLQEVLHG
jgi:perosamine synthetase